MTLSQILKRSHLFCFKVFGNMDVPTKLSTNKELRFHRKGKESGRVLARVFMNTRLGTSSQGAV
jgi:hypothetical protein